MKINYYFLGIKQTKQDNLFKNLPKFDDSNNMLLLEKHFTLSLDSHCTIRDALKYLKQHIQLEFQSAWYEKFKNLNQSVKITSEVLKQLKINCKENVELDMSVIDYMNHEPASSNITLCFAIIIQNSLDFKPEFLLSDNVQKILGENNHEHN